VRWRRLVVAVALLALAAFAAMLAADLRSWRSAVESGDVHFAQRPAAATWTSSAVLPFDPAVHILGLSGQLDFRRAEKRFATVSTEGNGVDDGFSESAARGSLETELTRLAQSTDRTRDSAADNLLGVLAFLDSKQQGPSGPAPVERSQADFEAAVEADPANEDAKFNLELLLRELVAKGSRRGSNNTSGGPAQGHRGGGGGVPGHGY
jgi:hypothetical protein